MLWSLGSVLLVLAIDRVGISRSNQWKNLQGPIGVVLALILLGEAATADLGPVLAGAVLVFLSAMSLSVPTGMGDASKENDRSGILLALGAALAFGLAAAYTKAFSGSADTTSLVLGASVGFAAVTWPTAVASGQARSAFGSGPRESMLALAGGLVFGMSIWLMALTFRYLPVSVGYTVIQLNSVWAVLAGVFWFREMGFRENRVRIVLGLCLAVAGVAVLGLS